MVNPVKKREPMTKMKFCPFCGIHLLEVGTNDNFFWCNKDRRYFQISNDNEEIETWIERDPDLCPSNFNPSKRNVIKGIKGIIHLE